MYIPFQTIIYKCQPCNNYVSSAFHGVVKIVEFVDPKYTSQNRSRVESGDIFGCPFCFLSMFMSAARNKSMIYQDLKKKVLYISKSSNHESEVITVIGIQ